MPAQLVQNFTCAIQRNSTSVGTTASSSALLNSNPNYPDVRIINYGTAGAQVAFGASGITAVNTAAAAGTNQVYVPANSNITYSGIAAVQGASVYYSAITDTGTASLILLVGAGR